jgi:hypothetical protein
MEAIWKAENDTHVLKIFVDDCAESPRTWENIGTMVCWHRHQKIGDEHNYEEPRDLFVDLAWSVPMENMFQHAINSKNLIEEDGKYKVIEHDINGNISYCSEYSVDEQDAVFGELICDILSIDDLINILLDNGYVILPVYMYEHSEIALSCSSFLGRAQHAEWDSGQVGFIYASPETIEKEYGGLNDENKQKTIDYIKNEVEVYSQYLNGSVYGYQLYRKVKATDAEGDEFEIEKEDDSCWGFYGTDWKTNGVLENLGSEFESLVEKL